MFKSLLIGMPGGWELILIVFVLLLIFGSTKLPQLARGMGKSINEFKKGLGEGRTEEEERAEAERRAQLRTGDAARVDDITSDNYTANKPRT